MLVQPWKILLIEDDRDDYLITKEMLAEVRAGQFTLDWVDNYSDALNACHLPECQDNPNKDCYDVLLIDYRLGPHDGLDLVRKLVQEGCEIPILLMTGQGSYAVDVEAMRAGVTDYLVKSELTPTLLERTIRYAIERKSAELALRRAHDELEQRVQERTQELRHVNEELMREIHERSLAQEALTKSEARFRKLAESTSTAIFIVQENRIRYANPAARIITGYETQELLGTEFWKLAHPAYQKALQQHGLSNPWSEEIPARYELKLITLRGEERWVDVTSGAMEYEGALAQVITVFDITERDHAERALKKAKEELELRVDERTRALRQANHQLGEANVQLASAIQQLQTVLQALPVAVWIADQSGSVIDQNEKAQQVFGGTALEGISSYARLKGWFSDSKEQLKPEDWALAKALALSEPVVAQVVEIERVDGRRSILINSAAPMIDSLGYLSGAVAVSQDITQLRRIEAEIQRDTARIELQHHLIQQREMERLDIARDLHDGPLQELIGIAYLLTAAIQQVSRREEQQKVLADDLGKIQDRLRAQIRELRVFCSELRPPTLTPFGLEKAIRSHAEAFNTRHPDLQIHLDLDQDANLLPEKMRMALFRIYQETLNNVVRHAQASEVGIRFSIENDQVRLELQDNGVGFEVPQAWVDLARGGHLGLVGAQERAEAVGGRLIIDSQPGAGTLVSIRVPHDAKKNGV